MERPLDFMQEELDATHGYLTGVRDTDNRELRTKELYERRPPVRAGRVQLVIVGILVGAVLGSGLVGIGSVVLDMFFS